MNDPDFPPRERYMEALKTWKYLHPGQHMMLAPDAMLRDLEALNFRWDEQQRFWRKLTDAECAAYDEDSK